MVSCGGSEFGSTFFVAESTGSTPFHLRVKRTSLNWLPEQLVGRLCLISMSIVNVIGAIQIELGVDCTTPRFKRPLSADIFDEVWRESPDIAMSDAHPSFHLKKEDELTREQLRRIVEQSS